jgi:3-dehydroquinate dehydratase-2
MKQMWIVLALVLFASPSLSQVSSFAKFHDSGDALRSSALPGEAPAAGTHSKRFKILVLQGANLAYLGRREPELYGKTTAAELDEMLHEHARTHGYDLEIFYTHVEGEAIGRLYRAVDEGFDGVVMNPGGFTYAGYALRDCLRALPFPYIEVHMTNSDKRGIRSVVAEVAVGVISGFGTTSYLLGLDAMLDQLHQATDKAQPQR